VENQSKRPSDLIDDREEPFMIPCAQLPASDARKGAPPALLYCVPIIRAYATDCRREYDCGPCKLSGKLLSRCINPWRAVSCISVILPPDFPLRILFGVFVSVVRNYIGQLLASPWFSPWQRQWVWYSRASYSILTLPIRQRLKLGRPGE
jgi:hypothetical protein